jgi:hypothetical protein
MIGIIARFSDRAPAPRYRLLMGAPGVLHAKAGGANAWTMLSRKLRRECAGLFIDDKINLVLPVQRNRSPFMATNVAKSQLGKQRFQSARIRGSEFDKVYSIQPYGIFWLHKRTSNGLTKNHDSAWV